MIRIDSPKSTGGVEEDERVAAEDSDLTWPAIDALRSAGVAVKVLQHGLSSADLATAAARANVLVLGPTPLDARAIRLLREVRLIARCGAGTDLIDLKAAHAAGKLVANVPDYCVDEVADHTILLMLAAARQLRHFTELLEKGQWKHLSYYPRVPRLRGRRLAIIGFGRIGARVAQRAQALGLSVTAVSPRLRPAELGAIGVQAATLEDAIAGSDVISLHCPLNPTTRHLLNRGRFQAMRPATIIVNTSRGGLVDMNALDEALESGTVAAAGLDVLDGEPTPNLDHPLLKRPNVIVTPHVAFYSTDARLELGARIAQDVVRFLHGGLPEYVVTE